MTEAVLFIKEKNISLHGALNELQVLHKTFNTYQMKIILVVSDKGAFALVNNVLITVLRFYGNLEVIFLETI